MNTASKISPIAVALGILLGLAAIASLGLGPPLGDPVLARYIDNEVHTLERTSDTWLKFDYGIINPVRSVVNLTLLNGTGSGVRLEVWAPEIIGNWWERTPTGRGTTMRLDCATRAPAADGACQSEDLTWAGIFGSFGTYYVRVVNDNPVPTVFRLVIRGESVSLGRIEIAGLAATPIPVPSPGATPAPTPVADPIGVDDPTRAASIDGQPHRIEGNSATWYKFEYVSNSQFHPVVMLKLLNGVVTRVGFQVWAPEHMNRWWEQNPVGRGTQEVIVNCFGTLPEATAIAPGDEPTPTPAPTATPTGQCVTNNLTWAGAFGAGGTYYVRVVNENSAAMDYTLILQ